MQTSHGGQRVDTPPLRRGRLLQGWGSTFVGKVKEHFYLERSPASALAVVAIGTARRLRTVCRASFFHFRSECRVMNEYVRDPGNRPRFPGVDA